MVENAVATWFGQQSGQPDQESIKLTLDRTDGGSQVINLDDTLREKVKSCIQESRNIEPDQVIEEALEEGTYRVFFQTGYGRTETWVLTTSLNITDGYAYYHNDCIYGLIKQSPSPSGKLMRPKDKSEPEQKPPASPSGRLTRPK